MNQTIRYHSLLDQDSQLLLNTFSVRDETLRMHDAVVAKIRKIVQLYEIEKGEQWDVEAVSPFVDHAPLELVVVDRRRPFGVPPEHGNRPLPSLYDHDLPGSYYSTTLCHHSFLIQLHRLHSFREIS
ncbi:hypothetical protein SISSUDRAFT_571123 [Sistotremastrum suecicum HHB10207 ss-3]|uniref:Uncharacterized protein n=1 Tax=Sistotremastrum suecicum HHB10207 ss-3 TaxID=1314776 RepID=A0A166ER72_9AGAM|nr:hypothetical protein SISSUDRAFT_571123 [Sistotremastrum suecicum HHB10207 ss-3]